MVNQEKIIELFGSEALKYLKNKNQGGKSNEKGNTYENFFATYKLALLSRDVLEDQQEILFSSQIMAFVDDLIIQSAQTRRCQHYQLKNTENLQWGTGLRSIADDFAKQHQLNQESSQDSEMILVVSTFELKERLVNTIPETIAKFSNVDYFPFASSLPKILKEQPDFSKAIEYLCAFDNPEPDKVECVASVLLGAWMSSEKSNISLKAVLEKARQSQPSYIRYLEDDCIQLDSEVEAILNQIEYFTYTLSKGFFQWQFAKGLDEGTLPYSCETENFRRFQERVKNNRPTNFEELEILF